MIAIAPATLKYIAFSNIWGNFGEIATEQGRMVGRVFNLGNFCAMHTCVDENRESHTTWNLALGAILGH